MPEGTSGETLSTLHKTMITFNMMTLDQLQRSGAIISGVTQLQDSLTAVISIDKQSMSW